MEPSPCKRETLGAVGMGGAVRPANLLLQGPPGFVQADTIVLPIDSDGGHEVESWSDGRRLPAVQVKQHGPQPAAGARRYGGPVQAEIF